MHSGFPLGFYRGHGMSRVSCGDQVGDDRGSFLFILDRGKRQKLRLAQVDRIQATQFLL